MQWNSTIIKGMLAGISNPENGPRYESPQLVIDDTMPSPLTQFIQDQTQALDIAPSPTLSGPYRVPTTQAFIAALGLRALIGKKVIVTAIMNADGRLLDTMTLLVEP